MYANEMIYALIRARVVSQELTRVRVLWFDGDTARGKTLQFFPSRSVKAAAIRAKIIKILF